LFQELFDEIVWRCIEVGLVDGKLLLTDSTHVKANVNDAKREIITVEQKPSAYMKRIDELASQEGLITKRQEASSLKEKTKEVTKSTTDSDSGILNRPGKPGGFHYLSHNTVDGNSGIITDVHVTAGNTRDSTPHSERIQEQIEKFGFDTEEIGGDAGYDNGEIHSDMLAMGIKTYITQAYDNIKTPEGKFPLSDYHFDVDNNCYICPAGCVLKYSMFKRGKGEKEYRSSSKDCKNCPFRSKCFSGKKNFRTIVRAYHQDEINIQHKNNKTIRYNEIMRKRQIWCEGNNSHQKARHRLKRAKMKGIEKVREQCLLSACALNLKRLVKRLKRLHIIAPIADFGDFFICIRVISVFEM
jgi:IS5 family transposase